MTGGNVTNVSPNLMVNNQMSTKTDDKSNGFLDVMSKNVADKTNVEVSKPIVASVSKTQNTDNAKTDTTVKSTQSTDNSQDTTNQVDDKTSKQTVTDDAKAKEATVVDDTDKVEEIAEEVVEVVENALNEFEENVRSVLEDALDITDDELDKAMETLGITFADLLNPKDVTQLMVEVTGVTDSVSIVLDEDLSNALSTVRDFGDQVINEVGLEPTTIQDVSKQVSGEFQELLQGMEATNEATPEEIVNIVNEKLTNISQVVTEEQPTVNVADAQTEEVAVNQEVVNTSTVEDTDSSEDVQPKVENTTEDATDTFTRTEIKTENSNSQSFTGRDENNFSQNFDNVNVNVGANLNQNQAVAAPEAKPVITRYETMQMISQISEQASVSITEENTSLEMILNPEHLGKIYLNVTHEQGAMKAKLVAQNEFVREALENQMAVLKDNLNKAGIKVQEVEVSAGAHEFERNLEEGMNGQEEQSRQQEQQATEQRRHRSIDLNNLDDLQGLMSEEEMLVAQMMKDQGNSVNYMA